MLTPSTRPRFWGINMQESGRERYEIKMIVNDIHYPTVKTWIRTHTAGFSESYPPRRVNNVYLDTFDMDNYLDNLDGTANRRKVRIRWYGDEFIIENAILEVKRKQSIKSWKESCSLAARFDLGDSRPWRHIISEVVSELPPAIAAQVGNSQTPILLNRYRREYYLAADGVVRLTIDFAQEVYDQFKSSFPNLTRRTPIPDNLIIEVKGPANSWDAISNIVSELPVNVSKNSKYAVGFEAIFAR